MPQIMYQEVKIISTYPAVYEPVGEATDEVPTFPIYFNSIDVGCVECGEDTVINFERA